jgi:NitT/TauT family transport system permease protein
MNMQQSENKSGSQDQLNTFAYPCLGILLAIVVWQLIVALLPNKQFSAGFAPLNAFEQLTVFVESNSFLQHSFPSLQRVICGLVIAFVIGVPIGILVGYFAKLQLITNATFQFIRMISPLAWMPVAIILFGVGNNAIIFLIAISAIWPIMLNTVHGVSTANPTWTKVVQMLGGNHWDVLRRAIIPAVIPDILTGVRIAVGLCWIVLVPAEMLGVSSGLGYYILDARDRFNYGEVAAVILVIGFFGYISDALIRALERRVSWHQEAKG